MLRTLPLLGAPMYNLFVKAMFAVFVVLLGAVFFWQPLATTFSKATVTNDFILQTSGGTLDSKALRGKVMLLLFGYARCTEPCATQLTKITKAYEMLSDGDRSQVKVVVVSFDAERDTPADISAYVKKFHSDFIGATGKPEEVKTLAEAFAADYQKTPPINGDYAIDFRPNTYIVAPDGRFVSVLNEAIPVEKIAAALRSRILTQLPPGK